MKNGKDLAEEILLQAIEPSAEDQMKAEEELLHLKENLMIQGIQAEIEAEDLIKAGATADLGGTGTIIEADLLRGDLFLVLEEDSFEKNNILEGHN